MLLLQANEAGLLLKIKKLKVSYSGKEVVHGVSMDIEPKSIVALIGASGCGKSTFLRCINRMNDLIESVHIEM